MWGVRKKFKVRLAGIIYYGQFRVGQSNCRLYQFRKKMGYRYEFSLVFLDYFFILLYNSYEIHLQNFEWLRPAVLKIQDIQIEIGCTLAPGVSFCSFSLIIFLFYSIIAMKSAYQVSNGHAQRF